MTARRIIETAIGLLIAAGLLVGVTYQAHAVAPVDTWPTSVSTSSVSSTVTSATPTKALKRVKKSQLVPRAKAAAERACKGADSIQKRWIKKSGKKWGMQWSCYTIP